MYTGLYYILTLPFFAMFLMYMVHICLKKYLMRNSHYFSLKQFFEIGNIVFLGIYATFIYLNFVLGYFYLVSLLLGSGPIILFHLGARKRSNKELASRRRRHHEQTL